MLAVNVVPTVETAADSGEEDDIAIWIHPTDTSLSRVIGTVKTSSSSLRVYNLQGQQVQSIPVANVNNVDLRYNFELSGRPVAIVAGSRRSNNSIVLYTMDSQSGLQNEAARTIGTGISIYGCAMYVSPTTGKYFVFVSSESGQVQQWELFDNGAGKVDALQVRSFAVGSQVEGIVADDELGNLYVGEEQGGIWRYSAEPNAGTTRTRVDTTGGGGHLSADVEGLTIYYAANGAGYLIASSQGNNEFAVYQRGGSNAYVNSFKLVAGGGIDGVSDTDGIDVTNFPLGNQFSQGMFVAQDNNDNFKFVKWDAIDAAFGGALVTDTTWDPRLIGSLPDPNVSHGDYNRSDTIDAADYVFWRKLSGDTGVAPYSGADGNGDGTIDDADYGVWQENFGGAVSAGSGGLGDDAIEAAEGSLAAISDWLVDPSFDRCDSANANDVGAHLSASIDESRSRDAAILAWLDSISAARQSRAKKEWDIQELADAMDSQTADVDELGENLDSQPMAALAVP